MPYYPSASIFTVFIIGIILTFINPRASIVFAILLASAMDINAGTLTRSYAGPYLNLVDVTLLVMFTGLLVHHIRSRKRVRFPYELVSLLLVIFISATLAIGKQGITYEVVRATRWSLNFPISILVGYNFFRTERDAKTLLYIVFWGSLIASVQHLFTVAVAPRSFNFFDSDVVRNVGFSFAGAPYLLLLAIFTNPFAQEQKRLKIIWLLALPVFALSLLLMQTRSIQISMLVTGAVTIVLLALTNPTRIRALAISVYVICLIMLRIVNVFPEISNASIIFRRYQGETFYEMDNGRWLGIQAEVEAWLDSNLIFGQGFAYRWSQRWVAEYGLGHDIAVFGHVGYTTYLANLGLAGLFVYGFVVPVSGLISSIRIYRAYPNSYLGVFGVMVFIAIFINVVMFAMSSSYLQSGYIVTGVLIGTSLAAGNQLRLIPSKRLVLQRSIHKPSIKPMFSRVSYQLNARQAKGTTTSRKI